MKVIVSTVLFKLSGVVCVISVISVFLMQLKSNLKLLLNHC